MSSPETKITPILESNFKFQVSKLDGDKNQKSAPQHRRASITISREFGCEGYPLAHRLAEKLNENAGSWHIFNRDIFNQISENPQYTERLLEEIRAERRNQLQQYLDHFFTHAPTELMQFKKLAQSIKAVAHKGHAIIVGAGGTILGQDDDSQFHVRLVADMDFKVKRLKPLVPDMSPAEIIETIEQTNRNRVEFIREFTAKDITDPSYYDLTLNNDRYTVDQMADVVIYTMKLRGLL